MEVILLEKIQNLGTVGDKVNVRAGYGRNYLIPQGRAVRATQENLQKFETQREELLKKSADSLAQAQARALELEGKVISIEAKASEEGKLFGSIGTRDISQAASDAGVSLHKNEVGLPSGPIRSIGEYDIQIHLHPDVVGSIKLNVVAE